MVRSMLEICCQPAETGILNSNHWVSPVTILVIHSIIHKYRVEHWVNS